ncbi:MAG: efflux RND transporter periplasmic adaptor subunit, partial [Planctomycetota bacterium]
GGDEVKAGDLLLRGDDTEERADAEFNQARADTELPLKQAKMRDELAGRNFARAETARAGDAMTDTEFEAAKMAMEDASVEVELAELNQVLSRSQAERAWARVEKLSLTAPFDGIVDRVQVDVGQSVREGDPVIRIVNIDKLWVDVPVSLDRAGAMSIRKDDTAWVLMPSGGKPNVYAAKVIEVSPTADAASGTRRVRVEIDNPTQIVSGLNCWVRFNEPSEDWMERVVDVERTAMATGQDVTAQTQAGAQR